MKHAHILAIAAATCFAASPALASTTYQVTGPVVNISAASITVQKGEEKWEIGRGNAALPPELKNGDRVTVEYTMTASKITAKEKTPPKNKPAKH